MPAKNAWNAQQSWVHKAGTELIKANHYVTIQKTALEKYGTEGSGKNLPFSSLSEDLKKKEEEKE